MTFLIAEDNCRMRESIKRFLSSKIPNHHTFYEAADGTEAVDIYNRVGPDWVLMDIEMEPMDGLVASKTILTSDPGAKIIILTSFDDAGYRKAAQQAGAYAYILKEHLNEIPIILSHAREN
jgi:DNA-binding NarL/FixJ family response regulator